MNELMSSTRISISTPIHEKSSGKTHSPEDQRVQSNVQSPLESKMINRALKTNLQIKLLDLIHRTSVMMYNRMSKSTLFQNNNNAVTSSIEDQSAHSLISPFWEDEMIDRILKSRPERLVVEVIHRTSVMTNTRASLSTLFQKNNNTETNIP